MYKGVCTARGRLHACTNARTHSRTHACAHARTHACRTHLPALPASPSSPWPASPSSLWVPSPSALGQGRRQQPPHQPALPVLCGRPCLQACARLHGQLVTRARIPPPLHASPALQTMHPPDACEMLTLLTMPLLAVLCSRERRRRPWGRCWRVAGAAAGAGGSGRVVGGPPGSVRMQECDWAGARLHPHTG